jgi:stage II sporulation protein D
VRARLSLALTAVLLVSGMPTFAAAAPLAALPPVIRVNISGLGVLYARIGSLTGLMTVTRPDGNRVYEGYLNTLIRLGVKRLADPSRAAARIPAGTSRDDRRELREQVREARLRALVDDVPIVTVPFEFAVDEPGGDPLSPPLLSAQQMVPLHFSASDGRLTYNGRIFRGTFDLTRDDEGDMILVNEVETSKYLASVVGSEEPTTWMPEALASQAIAARTYLVRHLARHDNYDIEGDTRDQEYDGLTGESDSTIRAVERTAGVIATYRGGAIEALYSANAGGYTEDSENVFANALPYLRAVPSPGDEEAKRSTWGHTSWEWTQEFTAPQLQSYLGVRGINVGVPQRIEVTRVSGTGRALTTRIVGSSGTRDIGKDVSRYYFGLRSTLFNVENRPEEIEYVDASNLDRVRELASLTAEVEHTFTVDVRDPDRAARTPRVLGWQYRLPARFVFTGRGYGHGVGMSQWGAQGMALAGKSAEEILKHYYPGIELTRLGGP